MTLHYISWSVVAVLARLLFLARITSGHCSFTRVWLVQDFSQYIQITTKYDDRELPRITKCLLFMLDLLFIYSFRSKKPGCRTFGHNKALGFRHNSTHVVISMYSVWAPCNYVTQPAHFGHGFIQFITRYRQIGNTHLTLAQTVLYHYFEKRWKYLNQWWKSIL